MVIIGNRKDCYFVDLFVRVSNSVAIKMYNCLGYTVYRRVLKYYSGEEEDEDAFGKNGLFSECRVNVCRYPDMRKALPRDVDKKSIIPLERPIRPEELEHP